MSTIRTDEALNGDVLAVDIIVNDVVLFTAGTALTTQRLEILRSLQVRTIDVEDRYKAQAAGGEATLQNIDARFSHVEGNPFMMQLRSWIKDNLVNMGGAGDR